jgi:hypothetical protein
MSVVHGRWVASRRNDRSTADVVRFGFQPWLWRAGRCAARDPAQPAPGAGVPRWRAQARPDVDVQGRIVFVVASLYGEPTCSVHDKLDDLLFFIGALKDAAADHVTAITPYLCYARQDHRIASGDPLALRYLAQLFEAIGTDRFVAIDVHNRASFENAFRIPIDHLEAAPLLSAELVSSFGLDREDLVVVSPDIGGVKRARRFQAELVELLQRDVALTSMGKRRLDHVVGADDVVPGVDDRIAVIVDRHDRDRRDAVACGRGVPERRSAEGLCGGHPWAVPSRRESAAGRSQP